MLKRKEFADFLCHFGIEDITLVRGLTKSFETIPTFGARIDVEPNEDGSFLFSVEAPFEDESETIKEMASEWTPISETNLGDVKYGNCVIFYDKGPKFFDENGLKAAFFNENSMMPKNIIFVGMVNGEPYEIHFMERVMDQEMTVLYVYRNAINGDAFSIH